LLGIVAFHYQINLSKVVGKGAPKFSSGVIIFREKYIYKNSTFILVKTGIAFQLNIFIFPNTLLTKIL